MIPYNVPTSLGSEFRYIEQVLKSSKLSGDGPFNKKCVAELKKFYPNSYITLTPSCTAALEMAYLLLDLKPNDEVIMPSFTFTSTATAVTLFGACPVFVGVDESLNIDLDQLEAAITKNTKAICVVHYAGFSCDMDRLLSIAKKHSIPVVEDAAQAIGVTFKGRPLGSFGDLAAISFHETKNVVCGEGGAIVVNNNTLFGRAEVLRDKGTNRQRFLRGEIDKYTWQDKGSSYLLGELPAAFLLAQLENVEKINAKRIEIFDRYFEKLNWGVDQGKFKLPRVLSYNKYNGHIFYLLLNSETERDRIQAHLKEKNIQAVSHYVPLHTSEAGLRFGKTCGNLNSTSDFAARLIRLPTYYNLNLTEVDQVADAVADFFRKS